MTSRLIASLLLPLLASETSLTAQGVAGLAGNILDPSGAGIAGAAITLVHEESGFRRVTQSQPDGAYSVWPLHPGVYKITVRKEGFRTLIRFGLRLSGPHSVRVDFSLPIGSMQESITVEGSAPLLSGETSSVHTVVSRDRLERLPANGRNLLGVLDLASGTVITPATRGEAGQFTANGQRPNAHYFAVDGVNMNTGVSGGGLPAQITGGTLPGLTAFGSLHSVAPLEATEEVRIETSTASGEFGRRTGAQIAIRSRSGTNEFHGSLFGDFRHEALAANDWFANRQGEKRAPLRLQDFGAALGGPASRDRTFFFASYEGLQMRQPFAWRAPTPSVAIREEMAAWLRPLIAFFPQPNGGELTANLGEWTGRNLRPSWLNTGSLRLDHALSAAVAVFGRYSDAPSVSEFGSAQINRLEMRMRSLTAGLNWRVRPWLALETRANTADAYAESAWHHAGGPERPVCDPLTLAPLARRDPSACHHLIRISIAGVGQVSSGQEAFRGQRQWYVAETAALTLGRHQIRAGADYLRLNPRFDDRTGTFSMMAESVTDLVSDQNLWTAYSDPRQGRTVFQQGAVFAQDTWQVTSRLTATFGVRWDFGLATVTQTPAYVYSPERGHIVALDRVTWPPGYSRLGPRVGAAYRLDAQGRTVVRAGGGWFYDGNSGVATDAVNAGPLNVQQFGSARFAPFSGLMSFGFPPEYRIPRVAQWNAAIERALSARDVVSAGYVGSAGRDLVRREMGGAGSSPTLRLALATNHGVSDYHGLQVQYRRRLARGWQGLVSYSWAHSIDNSSTDSLLHWAGPGFSPAQDRGSSDFDARHALTAAVSYELRPDAGGWSRGWGLDGLVRVRSGFPLDVLDAEQPMGLTFANVFRPDLVPGQPVWIAASTAPGGWRLNGLAFSRNPPGEQGSLGRNALTGFGLVQIDLALRKVLIARERYALQLRVEAFNALNHPNLADPVRFLANPLFGGSASMLNLMLGTGSPGSGLAPMFQSGGARSVQAGLRFRF